MHHYPVRNKVHTTSLLPLQQPMRTKKQMARLTTSSDRRPFSIKIPAEIMQTIFTPMSLFHQSLRSNQTVSSTPLLASTNTPTAPQSHLALHQLRMPALNTFRQMNQQSIAMSELSAAIFTVE